MPRFRLAYGVIRQLPDEAVVSRADDGSDRSSGRALGELGRS
jgi:hypothetical protein